MKRFYIFIFLLAQTIASLAGPLAEKGDKSYSAEDYASAINMYEQSLVNEGKSPIIYYNLGNAYFKANNLGKAILNYERALQLDPSFDDARDNLAFVNRKITDKPEDDSSYLSNLHVKISSWMSPDAWAIVAIIVFAILLGAVALYIFPGNIVMKKIGFFGGIVLIFILIYALVIAWQTADAHESHNEAVVMVPTSHLSSSPSAPKSKDEKVLPLHEGTKVLIIDSVATPEDKTTPMWYEVKINNSTRAWIRANDIEKI